MKKGNITIFCFVCLYLVAIGLSLFTNGQIKNLSTIFVVAVAVISVICSMIPDIKERELPLDEYDEYEERGEE